MKNENYPNRVELIVERMKHSKAMRYLSNEVRTKIGALIKDKEFLEAFEKEFNITNITDDEQTEIIEELLDVI